MYYQSYEDYARDVLGNRNTQNTRLNPMMPGSIVPNDMSNMQNWNMINPNMPNNMMNTNTNVPNNMMNTNVPNNMMNTNIPSNMMNTNVPNNMVNTNVPNMMNQNIPNSMMNQNIPNTAVNPNIPSNSMNNEMFGTPQNVYLQPQPMSNEEMANEQELERMYPEIYKIIYPMVIKICSENMSQQLTKERLEEMVTEILRNVGDEETGAQTTTTKTPITRNQNLKETNMTRIDGRRDRSGLQDLIRILILREFLRPRRPFFPPQRPRPPMHHREYNGLY